MLELDKLVKKASAGTSSFTVAIPKVWGKVLEINLRKEAVLEQSIVVNSDLMVPNAGDVAHMLSLPDFTAATSLTELTDMTVYTISSATTVDLTPVEYGLLVEISRKALDRIAFDGIAAIVDRLAYSMSLAIEGKISALTAHGSTTYTEMFPTTKAFGTLTTGDTFGVELLTRALAQLKASNNVPFSDGNYICYMSPTQWSAFIQDSNVRNDIRYAAPERLLNGEMGVYQGVHMVVTNYIQTGSNAGAGTVPYQVGVLVAPRWAAVAYKRKPEVYVDPTLYDGGRRRRFGVIADFDVQTLHTERALCLVTA